MIRSLSNKDLISLVKSHFQNLGVEVGNVKFYQNKEEVFPCIEFDARPSLSRSFEYDLNSLTITSRLLNRITRMPKQRKKKRYTFDLKDQEKLVKKIREIILQFSKPDQQILIEVYGLCRNTIIPKREFNGNNWRDVKAIRVLFIDYSDYWSAHLKHEKLINIIRTKLEEAGLAKCD